MSLEAATEAPAATPRRSRSFEQRTILTLSKVWSWLFLLVLIVFFSFEGTGFVSIRNSQNILVAITPILLMGLGQTFVIIAGGIDLSIGWVMGLASVVSALVIRDTVTLLTAEAERQGLSSFFYSVLTALGADGSPELFAIIIGFIFGIGVACLAGLVNGVIVAKLRVPPFIVTLGVSFIARGVALLLSRGNIVGGQPRLLRDFGNESLFYLVRGEEKAFYVLNRPELTGNDLRLLDRILAWPVVVWIIVAIILALILRSTQFGRHTYAIGGNKEAALRAGIPVERHLIKLYVLSGFTTGVAGVLNTARYSGGSSIAGDPLLMSSIAAVVIGGVSLFGGVGRVSGTVVGALIIAVLQTGLVMMAVEPFWQYVIVGIVVIMAVLMDQARDLIVGRAEA